MRQKDQKMRFTDAELALFKSLFAENEDLLFVIRKAMLQFELTKAERKSLDTVMTEPVKALISKTFLPKLDADAPLFQLVDIHLGLNLDMKSKGVDDMWPYILSKDIQEEYLEQQLNYLFDENAPISIVLSDMTKGLQLKGAHDAYVMVNTRNYLLSYIDSNIQQIKFLAGESKETVEETKKRLQQNSAK